jgi:hypothetical protein
MAVWMGLTLLGLAGVLVIVACVILHPRDIRHCVEIVAWLK